MNDLAATQAWYQATERVTALVLGGGRGTRLFPLTRERAKPAVPLGGRYRLVDIPLSNCIHSNVRRIFVLTQFNSASLNRHVNNSYKFDNFSQGFVEILAAEQTEERSDWYQGTADAVRQHLNTFAVQPCDNFLILSGDQLYRMDYRTMLMTHIRHDADITVAALPVNKASAKGFGVMHVNTEERITRFVEKPQTDAELADLVMPATLKEQYGLAESDDRQYLGSMGVYLFKAHVLQEILEKQDEWVDFGKHVIPMSLESRGVHAHLFDGFWEDIGTVGSYFETSLATLQDNPPFEFYDPKFPLYSRARYLPGARLGNATVTGSIICEGSRIGSGKISNSIVGIRSVIQDDVVIQRSILMGADYHEEQPPPGCVPMGIGSGTHISQAIIDKNARIGKNVVIKGSDELPDRFQDDWCVRDGIVIVLKGAEIADNTQIGAV